MRALLSRRRLWFACVLSLLAGLAWWTFSSSHRHCMADEPAGAAKGEHEHTNALIDETSPYLLQHAHNPVNWRPWGPEALAEAKEKNKPIFLSVGYSTCYWCHVMERESFENDEVAKVLNEHFIPVKVDREERPDIDEQYMTATQLITGRGGWPNSVWLTPDGRPWMAGTYFPRESFLSVLKQLAELWKEQPEAVEEQASRLAAAVERTSAPERTLTAESLNREPIRAALAELEEAFDQQHGGFGGAPKFPPHGSLKLLAAEYARSDDPKLRSMLTQTLDAMWRGGVHDHVGGGFHRYSTDEHWLLPHFEKMLYDNAQLLDVYAEAYALTGEESYRRASADIFAWLKREMTHPDGAFFSALDSESEGVEGKFYVWTEKELLDVLGDDDGRWLANIYGVEPEGNYEEERTGERTGENILHLQHSLEQIARQQSMEPEALSDRLARLRTKLLKVRMQREYPHLDDKILAGWNGLMIGALAHAGRVFEEPKYTRAARRAAEFVWTHMRDDGVLLRTWRAGKAKQPGYLNDYAFLAAGLLELYQTTGEQLWLDRSRELADEMLADFEDQERGGFYFTSDAHPELLTRTKNLLAGGNLPAGNGVAAEMLLELSDATEEPKYAEAARRTLDSLAGFMHRSPLAAESLLVATGRLLEKQSAATLAEAEQAEAAEVKAKAGPVQIVAAAKPGAAAPGETTMVEAALDIDEGWHLYGRNPNVEFVIPTTVKITAGEGLQVGEVQVPPGKTKQDPVLDKAVVVYEGKVTFRAKVKIGASAKPGKHTLQIAVRTQACDAARCLPPKNTKLELPVTVEEAE